MDSAHPSLTLITTLPRTLESASAQPRSACTPCLFVCFFVVPMGIRTESRIHLQPEAIAQAEQLYRYSQPWTIESIYRIHGQEPEATRAVVPVSQRAHLSLTIYTIIIFSYQQWCR